MNPAGNWTRFGCIATILLLFATFPVTGHAQGSLEGTVRDGATNQGVRGAQVFISALSIGRLSDADGSFQIGGIPAGTHVVEIGLIGYATERQEVSIADGQVTQLDVTISEEAIALAGIVAIGTRARPRTVTESAVPVDVITNAEIINQGDTDFANLLRNVVPSFNVNIQPISDAATFARPANLRGLAPDHTLILVNGKRRHRTAVITWYGNGLADGSQGPDIAMIPGMALEQAEVLRDGASAQYGSDAIAGVMNFVLNNNRSGGALEIKTGGHLFATTSEPFQDDPIPGDGEMYSIAGNIGLPLGETGFLNLTGEYGNTNPTDRSVQRNDALALVGAGNQHVRSPAQIWGSPQVSDEIKLWANTGYLFSDALLFYGHGNYVSKQVEGGFYFRNPNTRSWRVRDLECRRTVHSLGRRHDRRARRSAGRIGRLPGGTGERRRRDRSRGVEPGSKRPQLLHLPEDLPGRLHAAVRRIRARRLRSGRPQRHPGPAGLGHQRQLGQIQHGLIGDDRKLQSYNDLWPLAMLRVPLPICKYERDFAGSNGMAADDEAPPG